MLRTVLWCCHHDSHVRIHLQVHLMNVEPHKAIYLPQLMLRPIHSQNLKKWGSWFLDRQC